MRTKISVKEEFEEDYDNGDAIKMIELLLEDWISFMDDIQGSGPHEGLGNLIERFEWVEEADED